MAVRPLLRYPLALQSVLCLTNPLLQDFFIKEARRSSGKPSLPHQSPPGPPLRKPAGRPKLQAPKCPLAFFHDIKTNGCTQSMWPKMGQEEVRTQPLHAVAEETSYDECCDVCDWSLSHVRLFVTPWTVARQAPLSMEFSRQEYWSG